ncbi:HutD/Ves family protein [Escherichia coli]|uniref:HutD/Ves family protein n=1 Tax=Escherichia coli TaxID=562 RepID=UPI000CC87A77|nr:HutD family protein [Escherichia coli]OZP20592.1 HutD family protein [Escherichia coli]
MTGWQRFSQTRLPVSRWRNGGGETREIISWPPGQADFDWRASIATVAQDGPFSAFPGIARSITLLSGEGMQLTDGIGVNHVLNTVGEPFEFSGDLALHAHLLGGETMDFNLMTRRTVCLPGVVALRGSGTVSREQGGVLFAIQGDWQLPDGTRLGAGEGIWWPRRQTAVRRHSGRFLPCILWMHKKRAVCYFGRRSLPELVRPALVWRILRTYLIRQAEKTTGHRPK